MKVSICIATHNKPKILREVLASIYRQSLPFTAEVIVVDDCSTGDETRQACSDFAVFYLPLRHTHGYRNPSVARNWAYRVAKGEVLVCQSDDTIHDRGAIESLVADLEAEPNRFVIGTVYNTDLDGRVIPLHGSWPMLTAPQGNARRPLMFLGAVYRRDVYKVGGNDTDFTAPGWEDNWFADCLEKGAGLQPHYSGVAVGHHIHHERPDNLATITEPSRLLYESKVRQANLGEIPWAAPGAPWGIPQK